MFEETEFKIFTVFISYNAFLELFLCHYGEENKTHVICGAESKIAAMTSFHFKWKSLQLTVQEQSKK